jgi:hypothetical protein
MDALWLLQGPYEAKGWKTLEADSRAKKVDLLLFDRSAWALVQAADAPRQYEGLEPVTPPDGLYLDDQGRGIYAVAGRQVKSAREVIQALGPEAEALFLKLGDGDTVLERLGRVR